jgi:hypothetical protein
MWAGMLHMFFGNLIIGIGEGLILALLFKVGKLKSVLLLVAANYFSAWAGTFILHLLIVPALHLDIYNVLLFLWLLVIFTYLMTLVLEFPFVALVFRKDAKWFSKAVKGSLIIQTISYAVLFGWYWLASDASLVTDTEIVNPSEITLPGDVVIYYISPDHDKVYMRNLDEPGPSVIYEHRDNKLIGLILFASKSDPNRVDLEVSVETAGEDHSVVIKPAFVSRTSAPLNKTDGLSHQEAWRFVGNGLKLGDAIQSKWEFRLLPLSGVWGRQVHTDKVFHLYFETFLEHWFIRSAILLPGDIMLFQLGGDQICAYDIDGNKLALIARGDQPIAVLREDNDVH